MSRVVDFWHNFAAGRWTCLRWRRAIVLWLLGVLSIGMYTDNRTLVAQELQIIFDARQAISERRYNDASRLLLEYLDSTDESSQLIDQLIAEITADIQVQNARLDNLIEQLKLEPENVARIDVLIASLEQQAREFNIDIDTQALLARKVAIEANEKKQFDDLLEQITNNLNQGNYTAASARVNEISRVGRERIAVGIDSTNQQEQLTASIAVAATTLRQILNTTLPAIEALSATIVRRAGNRASLGTNSSDNLLALHQQLVEQRLQLQNNSLAIHTIANNNPDSYYGTLMKQLFPIGGNSGGATPIEAVGAVVANFNLEIANQFESAIYATLGEVSQRVATLSITDADGSIAQATEYAELYLELVAYPTSDPDISVSSNVITVATLNALSQPDDRQAAIMLGKALGLSQLSDMVSDFQTSVLISSTNTEDDGNALGSLTDDPLTLTLRQYQTNWESTAQSIQQSVAQTTYSNTVAQDVATSLNTISQLFDDILLSSQAAKITTVENLLQDTIALYREDIENGANLLVNARGFVSVGTNAIPQDDAVIARAYPQQAIDSIDEQLSMYEETLAEIEAIYIALPSANVSTLYENQAEFGEFFAQYLTMVEGLQGLRELAIAQIQQAEVLEFEGDRLADSSQNAVQQGDGVLANSLWDQASASYFASLALNESNEVREKIEQRGETIQQNILDLEYERVIRQVRTLLVDSRRAVALQDIDRAYQLLLEAADLWALTNTEPNQEVEKQLEFIRLVLTFEEQYNIGEDDSLYPVISGYLNGAAENLVLLTAGTLDVAEQNRIALETDRIINNILNIQPYNTEARTLNLILLRETNNEEFAIILEDLYNSASNTTQSTPQERLSTLYSIRNIDATYRDIDDAIEALEIEIGVRQAPVASTSVDESIELVARANELIATGNQTRIDAGRELILQALEVNPDNIEAQQVLDQLRLSGEVQVTYALNSEDAQLLNRAETLFLQGNVAQTFVILENLWQNADNRAYPPLANLRRRVATRLGI